MHLISKDEIHHAGAIGPVLLTYWRDTPTKGSILLRRRWLEERFQKHKAFGFLLVIEGPATFSFPDGEFIRESRSQLELLRDRPGFGAMVVGEAGVMSPLLRTFMRGQHSATKSSHQSKSFLSLESATRWLGDALAPWAGPSGDVILKAAKDLRAASNGPRVRSAPAA